MFFTVILFRRVVRVKANSLRALMEALAELRMRWRGIWDEANEWFEDGSRTVARAEHARPDFMRPQIRFAIDDETQTISAVLGGEL